MNEQTTFNQTNSYIHIRIYPISGVGSNLENAWGGVRISYFKGVMTLVRGVSPKYFLCIFRKRGRLEFDLKRGLRAQETQM